VLPDRATRLTEPWCGQGSESTLQPGEMGVPLKVDGSSYVVGFRLTENEHARRLGLDLGAATSTGLLHALWGLPHGIPVLRTAVAVRDIATLDEEGVGWMRCLGRTIIRTYQPPGVVGTIVVSDSSLSRAMSRAASHPSTVRRIAIWRRRSNTTPRLRQAQLDYAAEFGLGIYATVGDETTQLLAADPGLTGLPAVFRWWQAELAYRNWLMHNTPTAQVAASA
jgi:hypothetical protein